MPAHDSNRPLIDALVRRIRDDRTHGASELARLALQSLQEFLESAPQRDPHTLRDDALDLVDRLQHARPSMVVLANRLQRWRSITESSTPATTEQFVQQALASIQQLVTASGAATELAAEQAIKLVTTGQTLLTHSYSSTVRTLFRRVATKKVSYIITESAPGREGERLAHELADAGLVFHYITDAQAGLFVPRADCVFVGADTLLADGSVVNKAGTLLLALAAREFGVPFYVCCESFKQSSLAVADITLEAMSCSEIHLQDLPGMTRHNIYFDITPAHLVSGWITEHGLSVYPGCRNDGSDNGIQEK